MAHLSPPLIAPRAPPPPAPPPLSTSLTRSGLYLEGLPTSHDPHSLFHFVYAHWCLSAGRSWPPYNYPTPPNRFLNLFKIYSHRQRSIIHTNVLHMTPVQKCYSSILPCVWVPPYTTQGKQEDEGNPRGPAHFENVMKECSVGGGWMLR